MRRRVALACGLSLCVALAAAAPARAGEAPADFSGPSLGLRLQWLGEAHLNAGLVIFGDIMMAASMGCADATGATTQADIDWHARVAGLTIAYELGD